MFVGLAPFNPSVAWTVQITPEEIRQPSMQRVFLILPNEKVLQFILENEHVQFRVN